MSIILWVSWSSNTLVTWCKEPTHWKKPWRWERLRARGEGGDRGWDWLNGITDSMDMSLSQLQNIVKDRGAWRAVVQGVTRSQTTKRLNNHTCIWRIQAAGPPRCSVRSHRLLFHDCIILSQSSLLTLAKMRGWQRKEGAVSVFGGRAFSSPLQRYCILHLFSRNLPGEEMSLAVLISLELQLSCFGSKKLKLELWVGIAFGWIPLVDLVTCS